MDSPVMEEAAADLVKATASGDEEREEIRHELEVLKADQVYADFVEKVLYSKDSVVEDDADDPVYVPDNEKEKETNEDAQNEESADTSSSESDEDIDDDCKEVVGEGIEDVCVPPAMAKEARKRFPPFWRVNGQLKKLEDDAAEEDAEFVVADGATSDTDSDTDSEEYASAREDDEGDANTSAMDAESELVERVQGMAIVTDVQVPPPDFDDDDDDNVVQMPSLVEAIESFDVTGYKSEDDPTYEPSEPSDKSSDSELDTDGEDNSESEEKMEE